MIAGGYLRRLPVVLLPFKVTPVTSIGGGISSACYYVLLGLDITLAGDLVRLLNLPGLEDFIAVVIESFFYPLLMTTLSLVSLTFSALGFTF